MYAPIRYTVDLTARLQHSVTVSCEVPADLSAGAELMFSVWTPGSYVRRDYVRHLQWIAAKDGDGREIELTQVAGGSWRIPDDVTGAVTVSLELYANDLSVRTNHVDDHHALLIPAATFPYVKGGEGRPHEVRLAAHPPEHRVWSLLPPGEEPDTYLAEDRDHLIDSAFEVGDLPSVEFDVRGVSHTFVWAGHGGAPSLDDIAENVSAIAESCIALFGGDFPLERYTILTTGWDEGGGGLEHRDGAVLQMPVRTFQDADLSARFLSLIAHEYLHLWNVKRLTPAALTSPVYESATRSESLWVAEGWTAYYDELLCVRAGVWQTTRLLDTLASTYDQVLQTPGASLQSLRSAGYQAWEKHYRRDENAPNAMTDYYGHGSIVAWEIDLRLRLTRPESNGIDDVLRTLWRRHAGSPEGYTEEDVLRAIATIGGDDLAGLAEQRVSTPQLPDLEAVVAAVGLRWCANDDDDTPSLGVRICESNAGVRFSSVLRDGPAWHSGITGGDRLVAVNGARVARGELPATLRRHDPGEEVEVTVERGPRLVTARPVLGKPSTARVLRRVVNPTAVQEAAFEAWTGASLHEVTEVSPDTGHGTPPLRP